MDRHGLVASVECLDFPGAVAGDRMIRPNGCALWRHQTGVNGEPAARPEPASVRRIEQVRRCAVDRLQFRSTRPIQSGHGAEKSARVRVRRVAEHGFGRAAFNHAGGIHDVHAVGVSGNDAEIVRDDHDRDAEPSRQILHQFEDLRLDRYIESRRRLVRDQQFWIASKSNRDHHPLAHAPG